MFHVQAFSVPILIIVRINTLLTEISYNLLYILKNVRFLVADKKRLLLFVIVLIIVTIVEASIIFYTNIEKPSQKAAIESKKISIHLTSYQPTSCKPKIKPIQKSVTKPKPKIKPKPKPKLKPKPRPKPKPKPKPKLTHKPKAKLKSKYKPVQKKLLKQSKIEKKKKQPKDIVKPQPKTVSSTPKKSNPSAQKVDNTKIDLIKSAYLKEIRQLIEFNKYYPRRAKRMHQTGVVEIEFMILKNGKISNITVLKRCRYKILNRAAKKTLEKIGSFKPLPDAFKSNSLTLRVPINYILKH